MNLPKAKGQMSAKAEPSPEKRGEAPRVRRSDEARGANQEEGRSGNDDGLMEAVVACDNVITAWKRVRKNKGSPGVDGMRVEELPEHLRTNWAEIRRHLLAGTYRPSPVRRQSIPKSDGGTRELGIPTVLDRFIQQAILQVLQPRFDPTFSEHSHGFRPGPRRGGARCRA